MCMSPHEMSSKRIEEDIAWMEAELEKAPNSPHARRYRYVIDELRKILKERAEEGTY